MKALLIWYRSFSAQTRIFMWLSIFAVAVGMLLGWLLFAEKSERAVIQTQLDVYRDSLAIQRYKTQELIQLLIKDEIQDENDSVDLRSFSLDSLIRYVSEQEVVTRASKND